jgi:hypothetical protein
LASSTLIVLYSKSWNPKKKLKISEMFFVKGNKKSDGIFGNISFFEMKSSKLINYSINKC